MNLIDSDFTALLVIVTVPLSVLVLLRSLLTQKHSLYLFIFWNMFLAAIPAALIPLFLHLYDHANGWHLVATLLIFGAVWLLFLPNAFYLLTDMMHLNQEVLVTERNNKFKPSLIYSRGDAWFIFEAFMLFLLVLFGALTGGYAIDWLHDFLYLHYGFVAMPLMVCALLASALGVYLGRFGRWNSWDMLTRPFVVIKDLIRMVTSKHERKPLIIITATIMAMELFSWAMVSVLRR